MSKYTTFKFDKMSRDHAIRDLTSKGIIVDHQLLPESEVVPKLMHKLVEEALEVAAETDREKIIEELADLKQIALSLMHALEINDREVEANRIDKTRRKGGYEQRIYIDTIQVMKGTSHEAHFLEQPHKYPILDSEAA